MTWDINVHLLSETAKGISATAIDINEILMLLIGAGIGLFSSILTLGIERYWNRRGKLNIYYKAVVRKTNHEGWGFEFNQADLLWHFSFPVYFEFQNTSNTTRVIRDVNMLLYEGEKKIATMRQIGPVHVTQRRGSEIVSEKKYQFGDEKGSYSFVLPPQSIQKQECWYVFSIEPEEKEKQHFDRVILRYYDEKNQAHEFFARSIDKCWEYQKHSSDNEWTLLK